MGAVREDVTESEHEGAVGAGAEVGVGARCGVEVVVDGADVGVGHEVGAAKAGMVLGARSSCTHLRV